MSVAGRLVLLPLAALLLVAASPALAQEKLSHDEWQRQVEQYTTLRNTEKATADGLDRQLTDLRRESAKLDADYQACLNELYALVGSDASKAEAYRSEIASAESKARELLALSQAELLSRGDDVRSLAATVHGLHGNKLSLLPEFSDRLAALDTDVARLEKTLAGSQKTYTVRTWAHDRDCLWTISGRKAIYGDVWLWPKIWEGNRDKIKDPDRIFPGEKLMIPEKAPLTAAEKRAEHSYYASREQHPARKPLAKK